MDQMIHLIGSFYLSGYVILIVLYMNAQMSETVSQYLQDTNSERGAISISQVMEYDFYKAGYKVSGNKILQADSNAVKFVGDLGNNGSIDTVYYFVNSTRSLAGTRNPNDYTLMRQVNSANADIIGYVTALRFTYEDSTGTAVGYADLQNQANRNKVDYLNITLRCETTDSSSRNYSPVEWRKKIRPKNL